MGDDDAVPDFLLSNFLVCCVVAMYGFLGSMCALLVWLLFDFFIFCFPFVIYGRCVL